MQHLIVQQALQQAIDALELRAWDLPQILPEDGYAPREERCDAVHITVGSGGIQHHEYSSDWREWPYVSFTYPSLQVFIRRHTDQLIKQACGTRWIMTTSSQIALEQAIAGGGSGASFAIRQLDRQDLDRQLDHDFNSDAYRSLERLLQP